MSQSIGKCSAWAWRQPAGRALWSSTFTRQLSKPASTFTHSGPAAREFDLPSLDKKWQTEWLREKKTSGHEQMDRKKMYILPMFPYPSGDLHLGHLRVYAIADVLARFRRMQGYNVIHPIGWDAFGLPAENAAIERGIDPAAWTTSNIFRMKSQLKAMNGSWDWDREFATCDPTFYKHTQRLFLMLHEHGLAYQSEALVNYDPVDKTVLANEQVDANGCSWRSGAQVEKKMLKQWFFKISAFREELLRDLDLLSRNGAWPERIISMQRNWLGKSLGARIKFNVTAANEAYSDIEVFTTRPDTLFGVQYLALSAMHPIVQELAKEDVELQDFLDAMPQLPPDSKAGYLLHNVHAKNPLSSHEGAALGCEFLKNNLPVYVAPYVLGEYGDGAVMGVPGHDLRDHAFWKHNCKDEKIRIVLAPVEAGAKKDQPSKKDQPYTLQGVLTSQCGPYSGQLSVQASKNLVKSLESRGSGSSAETWRLRDWLISRQRYWGTPIPIIHCEACGPVPVPDDQLPVELPSVVKHWKGGKVGNPLDDDHKWVNISCPKCHGPAKRDTDTMDTFVDSSWYFMRFLDPKNGSLPFSPDLADELLPVDVYVGGVEHAILHLLYARFLSKFIATTGLWKSDNRGEPFKNVLAQGMVHGKTYSDPSTGRFLKPNEVDLRDIARPIVQATGEVATVSFEKMSKSKYNGVDPGTCIAKYGADATRAHMLFQAPVSEVLEWDEKKISGVTRWMRRIAEHIVALQSEPRVENILPTPKKIFEDGAEGVKDMKAGKWNHPSLSFANDETKRFARESLTQFLENDSKLWREVQTAIGNVTQAYSETYSLNTVVSDLMSLSNAIIDHSKFETTPLQGVTLPTGIGKSPGLLITNIHACKALIQMMAPITPAFSEEYWEILNRPKRSLIIPAPGGWIDHAFVRVLIFLRGCRRKFLKDLGLRSDVPSDSLKEFVVLRYPRLYISTGRFGKPVPSVFSEPFPEQDGTLSILKASTQKCAVQVNGKVKLVLDIPLLPTNLKDKELESWIVKEILRSPDAKTKFYGAIDIKKAKKVIVVKGGKTVNFVL